MVPGSHGASGDVVRQRKGTAGVMASDLTAMELYTGGNDRQILVWSPPKLNSADVDEFDRRMGQHSTVDEDNWSD
ncbi:hypothetical protein Tco_0394162 [Tanacetum coccineum]